MTYGDLRRKLARARRHGGAGGMSILNPTLTKDQALDILTKAIADHPDDREVTARDGGLLQRNILRECGCGHQ